MSDQATSMNELKAVIERTLRPPRSPWLTPHQAAEYLNSTIGSLKTWRAQGRGPRFHGKRRFVRYHTDDLDAFLRSEVRS